VPIGALGYLSLEAEAEAEANRLLYAYLNVTLDFGHCGRQARGVLTGLAVASS
jgi:hypothetical protein